MKRWLFAVCLAAGVATQAQAGTVLTTACERVEGRLLLDSDGKISVVPSAGAVRKFDLSGIIVINFRDSAAAPDRSLARGVALRNGELIVDSLDPQSDGSVRLKKRSVTVPAAAISRAGYLAEPRATLKPNQTGVVLPNGDFFEGEIRGFSSAGVKVKSPIFGIRTFAIPEIYAALLRPVETALTQYELTTADGSRFFPETLVLDRDPVVFKDQMLGEVKVRADEILEIRLGNARARALNEIKPLRVDVVKGLDPATAVSVDKAATGEPLVMSGQPVEHGIETALGSAVTYAVPVGFGAFVCQAGVPEKIPPQAKLVFAVFADGRIVFRSSARTSGDSPLPIRVNFGSAQLLTLRIESVVAGIAQASGIWIQPMFLQR